MSGATRRAVAVLALLLAGCGGDAPPDGPLRFPDAPLVIISVDTLRADRLGCYGYGRGTSPHLDALAGEAVRFEDCYSAACKTAESHMSLFTSLPPTVHGVHNFSPRLKIEQPALAENRLTLTQVLRRAGRFNSAVACGGQITAAMGFQRGFEDRFISELVDVSVIVDRALRYVDASLAQDRPWMLFAHTYQVHGPYLPPPAFRERFAPQLTGVVGEHVRQLESLSFDEQWRAMFPVFWKGLLDFGADEARLLSDLYDGEIAYTDEQLGRFLDGLRQRGVYDRAVIVLLADHGEEFMEHGHFEHDQLYRELLHVPLLVRLPGGRLGGTRVQGQCSLLDVMPTLLDLLGLEGPETMAGHSLVPAMGAGHTANDAVIAERLMFAESYAASLRTPDTTLLFRFDPTQPQSDERPGPGPEAGRPAGEGRIEVYDRRSDPAELHDLGSTAPQWEAATSGFHRRLAALFDLRQQLDAVAKGGAVALTPEQIAELVNLGYAGTPLDRWPAHAGR